MQRIAKTILLTGIWLYRKISAVSGVRSSCRFYPTCSCYMDQAIRKFGPLQGLKMGIGRLLRCHPWNAGGVDLPKMESL